MDIGNLSLIDVNRKPFCLQEGDIMVLCSDGLYKSLPEAEGKYCLGVIWQIARLFSGKGLRA